MKVCIALQAFAVRAAALAFAALLAVGVQSNALLAADGTTDGWATAGTALAVETIDTDPSQTPRATVIVPTLNLRAGPGTEYPVLAQFSDGARLLVQGKYGDCDWLYVSNSGKTGWVSGRSSYVALNTACSQVPVKTFRPYTGILKAPEAGGGEHELEIENGTSNDAVAVLTLRGDTVASAYIRSYSTFTITGIPDGVYDLYFTTGTNWTGSEFSNNDSHSKFDESFPFETTYEGQYYYSTVWSVSLQPVLYGNADTDEVPESEFPPIY